MKLRFLALITAVLFTSLSTAQSSIHDYHYIFVPDQFEFLKGKDQYQVNSLVRFLFKKHGFNAYIGNELPLYLKEQPCKGLYADVQGVENFMHSKIVININDCEGNTLFTSQEGKSKDKDYRKAYHGAVREAFISIAELNVNQLALAEPEEEDEVVEDTVDQLDPPPPPLEIEVVEEEEQVSEAVEAQADNTATAASTVIDELEEIKEKALVYNDYELLFKDDVYVIMYKGDIIGKSFSTQEDGVYDIQTKQFNGKGYVEGENFKIERAIEGMDQTVIMLFKPKQ
ncbi:hypothetical protein [Gilvibacter sediminis]|uniref:hypothetical protein n=1 Tax=Gilvibacter sediminis TaxID=379071 RepID=UPI0023505AC1|nr:hypothetical protein [Gilvibacter sediminis]MDC7997612.1 hypothetical protein [Gilvibacter sediminis]